MGNPQEYSTFVDESLNGRLAEICRATHRVAFERRALAKFDFAFGAGLLKNQPKNAAANVPPKRRRR